MLGCFYDAENALQRNCFFLAFVLVFLEPEGGFGDDKGTFSLVVVDVHGNLGRIDEG
jgi:hypothetical protein